MNDNLIDIIRRLDPTGTEGFEGLVADLLEALTGRRFRLARSGSQMGRDLNSRHADANIVAVECKRYGEDTKLKERELQGELTQAVMDIPDLDLWMLVTSRDVPSQLHGLLCKQARRENVEFLSVSLNDGEPSSLEALCAQAPEIVTAYAESYTSDEQTQTVAQSLDEIAAHPGFAAVVESLRDVFLSPLIGYDNWRLAQNQWFTSCLASERESRAHFSQPLNVRETGVMLVPREPAWARLDEWFSNWGDTHEMFVMLGEEGDGKTWTVASWLDHNIQEETGFPAVVFLSSKRVESNEPLALVSSATFRRLLTLRIEDWMQRIARWTDEPAENAPRVLLVLDGINERGTHTWWRELLQQIAVSPWRNSMAVLITCRTAYWERYFDFLRYLEIAKYVLPAYNDNELDVALNYHDLSRSDISDELLPLIRKPRYFDLMIRHRERMVESGDVTVPRLIYEDWHDRLRRKGIELDNEGFRRLLKDLASAYLEGQHDLEERDLDDLLPSYYGNRRATIEELRTGGILNTDEGHLRVDEDRLVHGFGLLLVAQIRGAAATSGPNWGELIAEWLEPQAEMDIKARICEFAVLHALRLTVLPQEAKVALLDTWVSSHNPGEAAAENLVSYLPLDPACYTQLAEVVWSDATDNPWAQELLMQAFLRWHSVPEVTSQLESAFERWLGFVHLYGAPHQRAETEEDAQGLRQEICDRVGLDLEPGPFEFAGRSLIATEDDELLRLGRAALAVISHISREPFVRAIATSCLAEAIMGFPAKYELFKWVMSTARQSAWAEVKQEVEQLLETKHLVTKQAAYRLLSFEGGEDACELQNTFPNGLFSKSALRKRYEQDPCIWSFPWPQEVCERCAQRNDLSPHQIARGLKRQCRNPTLSVPDDLGTRLETLVEDLELDSIWSLLGATKDEIMLEEYEPCLCAYAPHIMADLVRRIVRQADQREGMSLRQLAWRLNEYSLIFEKEEVDSIHSAWEKLCADVPTWDRTQKETALFLFRSVLRGLDAPEQLEQLLERPEESLDWTAYRAGFLPINDWGDVWKKLSSSQSTERIKRILWFLSAHPEIIPCDFISEKLVLFLRHEDSFIRSLILKIAYVAKNEEIVAAVLESGWAWSNLFCDRENHWGSLLLCEHGFSLAYSELRNRVHPSYLGYAVKCRGLAEEVNQYAEDIDHIWSRIGTEAPDLPVDFPPVDIEASDVVTKLTRRSLSSSTLSKSITFLSRSSTWGDASEDDFKELFPNWEAIDKQRAKMAEIVQQAVEEQKEAGNAWFADRFHGATLEEVLETRPDLVSKWVNFALEDSGAGMRWIRLARSFYTELCAMLLKHEPSTGTRLYQRLVEVGGGTTVVDSRSKIPLLDYALFEAPAIDIVCFAWKRRLEKCTTDEELMHVAIVAQFGNGRDWLQSYIDQRIDSSAALGKSRAFTLMGFIETQETCECLSQLSETAPDTWIRDLLKTSLTRWQTNAWAKHWFERFLTDEDSIGAWAAFRIFLHCVDSRFWLWQKRSRCKVEVNHQLARRIIFLEDNLHVVKKRITKNEKDLEKHLFGQKTKPGQAWPWM